MREAFHAVCSQLSGGVRLPGRAAVRGHVDDDRDAEARWSEAEPFEQRPELLTPAAHAFLAAGDAVTTDLYVRAQAHRETSTAPTPTSSPAPACC